jgi:hypothetical protein
MGTTRKTKISTPRFFDLFRRADIAWLSDRHEGAKVAPDHAASEETQKKGGGLTTRSSRQLGTACEASGRTTLSWDSRTMSNAMWK